MALVLPTARRSGAARGPGCRAAAGPARPRPAGRCQSLSRVTYRAAADWSIPDQAAVRLCLVYRQPSMQALNLEGRCSIDGAAQFWTFGARTGLSFSRRCILAVQVAARISAPRQ